MATIFSKLLPKKPTGDQPAELEEDVVDREVADEAGVGDEEVEDLDPEGSDEHPPAFRVTKLGMFCLASATVVASHMFGLVGGIYVIGAYTTGKTSVVLKRLFDRSQLYYTDEELIPRTKTEKLLAFAGNAAVSLVTGIGVTMAALYGHAQLQNHIASTGEHDDAFNKKIAGEFAKTGTVVAGVPTVVKIGGNNLVGENGVYSKTVPGGDVVLCMEVPSPLQGVLTNPLGSKSRILITDPIPSGKISERDGVFSGNKAYFAKQFASLQNRNVDNGHNFDGAYLVKLGKKEFDAACDAAANLVKPYLTKLRKAFDLPNNNM